MAATSRVPVSSRPISTHDSAFSVLEVVALNSTESTEEMSQGMGILWLHDADF